MDIRKSIPSFTIFEVTMVLAIMSILVMIVSTSINRFNEQLKVVDDIKAELNYFHVVRANIWKDLYLADSISMVNNQLIISQGDIKQGYKIEEGLLYRKNNSDWFNLAIEATSIFKSTEENTPVFHIVFPWKSNEIDLEYYYKPSIDRSVNAYFDGL